MVLIAVVGELGSGKTLTMTYLVWRNWYYKKKKVFSNYKLYGIPFTLVNSLQDFEQISDGVFAGDELWSWADSRLSQKARNRFVSTILLKSRKRGLTVIYTSQSFDQIDKRIRKVTDFVAYPIMNRTNEVCKVLLFKGSKPNPTNLMHTLYFKTQPIFELYDSTEEIGELLEEDYEPLKEQFIPIEKNPALHKKVY